MDILSSCEVYKREIAELQAQVHALLVRVKDLNDEKIALQNEIKELKKHNEI